MPEAKRKNEAAAASTAAAAAAAASPSEDSSNQSEVPHLVREALLFRLKQRAMSSCSVYAAAMAACAKDRTVSTVWACRSELNALNECLGKHTNDKVLGELERRWVAAGRPEKPEWGELLEGLQ